MTVAVDIFRALAACTSTIMLLSPIPMIWRTWKTKTTGVASIVPLVTMLANSHNNVLYGYLSKHYFPIFWTFLIGDILCIIYITVFYTYSPEKGKAHLVFLLFGVPIVVLTLYGILGGFGDLGQTRHGTSNVFAYIAVLTNLMLYSSPLEKAAMVLRHRSAVFFNIHMVMAGTFNVSVWIVYTALTGQWILFIPMVICAVGGVVQIALYFIYHPDTHPYTGPIPGMLPTTLSLASLPIESPRPRVKTVIVVTPESPVYVSLEALQLSTKAHEVQPSSPEFRC